MGTVIGAIVSFGGGTFLINMFERMTSMELDDRATVFFLFILGFTSDAIMSGIESIVENWIKKKVDDTAYKE